MLHFPLPSYYVIEPTNICNFRCPICPHSLNQLYQKPGKMSLTLLDKILCQIYEYAKVIQLYWMGEPLLNPEIFEMISSCKKKTNAKVIISTNGSLLTREVSKKLVDCGLDEIIVSVDACNSQDIYGKIRVGGDVSLLNQNIEKLIENKGHMSVVLQFIDMFVNRAEREKFFHRWKDFDCKTELSCLFTWSNQIPSLNLVSDHLSPVQKKNRIPCADLWNKMVIHWDGQVSACCFDYANRLPFGDCTNTLLEDIWNSPEAKSLRLQHEQGKYLSQLCLECDAWAEPNEYVEMFHL